MKTTIKIISAVAFVLYATSSMALGQGDPVPTDGSVKIYETMTKLLNGISSKSVQAEFRYREMGWGITYFGLVVDK